MLLTTVIRLLEVLFVVGAVGSGIVVLMTAVEDIKMLFMREEKAIPTGQD